MDYTNTPNKETKYLRARDRVTELKDFYGRCFRGLIAIIIVAAINYYLNEWYHPWFLWVVFGVGLSLVLKAFRIFGLNGIMGRDWEERKIKQYMEEDRY
ncbi:MAG: 2TM domain-containing protein [Flavobacteriaceae bacterium]|nr:2TM domain-containing protein [Flavobacteriaceae bacterium]